VREKRPREKSLIIGINSSKIRTYFFIPALLKPISNE